MEWNDLAGHGNPASVCQHKITGNYLILVYSATVLNFMKYDDKYIEFNKFSLDLQERQKILWTIRK